MVLLATVDAEGFRDHHGTGGEFEISCGLSMDEAVKISSAAVSLPFLVVLTCLEWVSAYLDTAEARQRLLPKPECSPRSTLCTRFLAEQFVGLSMRVVSRCCNAFCIAKMAIARFDRVVVDDLPAKKSVVVRKGHCPFIHADRAANFFVSHADLKASINRRPSCFWIIASAFKV